MTNQGRPRSSSRRPPPGARHGPARGQLRIRDQEGRRPVDAELLADLAGADLSGAGAAGGGGLLAGAATPRAAGPGRPTRSPARRGGAQRLAALGEGGRGADPRRSDAEAVHGRRARRARGSARADPTAARAQPREKGGAAAVRSSRRRRRSNPGDPLRRRRRPPLRRSGRLRRGLAGAAGEGARREEAAERAHPVGTGRR